MGLRRGDRCFTVDQDTVEIRNGAQDRSQEDASAASHVDQTAQAREVVRGDDVVGLLLGPAGHGALERRLMVGVAGQVLEEALPVDTIERRPSPQHAVQQSGRRAVVQLAPDEGGALQRRESFPHRCEGEPPVALLGEHVVDHQAPQHADQRVAVGTDRVGDLGSAPGPVRRGRRRGRAWRPRTRVAWSQSHRAGASAPTRAGRQPCP